MNKRKTRFYSRLFYAPRVGFEPTTNWLTANCATAALPGNIKFYFKPGPSVLQKTKMFKQHFMTLF